MPNSISKTINKQITDGATSTEGNEIFKLITDLIAGLDKQDRYLRLRQSIDATKGALDIPSFAKLLGVSKSGYYNWKKRDCGKKTTRIKYPNLDGDVKRIFDKSGETYGRQRICIELRKIEEYKSIDEGTVRRAMKRQNIVSLYRPKDPAIYETKNLSFAANDHVRRNFRGLYFAEKWFTDVCVLTTYRTNKEGKKESDFIYLSAVMDGWSKEIVDFKISLTKEQEYTYKNITDAMEKGKMIAGKTIRPVIHSDCGVEYSREKYRNIADKYGFVRSMGRTHQTHDNMEIERFFGTMRGEAIKGIPTDKRTIKKLTKVITDWINYYNNERIITKFKCSPVEFRKANFIPNEDKKYKLRIEKRHERFLKDDIDKRTFTPVEYKGGEETLVRIKKTIGTFSKRA